MLDPSPYAPADAGRRLQQITLASLAYVRDLVRITGAEGDLVEALVFTTTLDANMAPVDRDADLTVVYGGLDRPAPDELRRPVSMNAVAQSLGLPFETVRRRFVSLTRQGLCRAVPGGMIAPQSAVASASYAAMQLARYERTRRLYLDLAAAGALPAPCAQAHEASDPLVRAVNRAVSEYALRVCARLVAVTGAVLTSLVLLHLVVENLEALDPDDLRSWMRAPQAYGRPRRIIELSGGLSLSRETVRRHLQLLEAMGYCRKGPGGCLATPPPQSWPQLGAMARANASDLQRMLGRIERLGVCRRWIAEAQARPQPRLVVANWAS